VLRAFSNSERIFPLAQQRLSLTTNYQSSTYDKIKANEPDSTDTISSFGVVIPIEEVVAASLYLPHIHAKYFPHKPEYCADPLAID